MSDRKAKVSRSTEKSEVRVVFDLDGSGLGVVQTGIPFLDQMLLLFARQGGFNLDIQCKAGDSQPGEILEEVALCLGLALDKALGTKQKIARAGLGYAPVQEHLARAVVEISGHSCLVYRVHASMPSPGEMESGQMETFWRALVSQARLTLHIELLYGGEGLPAFEAIFKATARALSEACAIPH
jgi:imidazoleglycerol-phosphate dehydratase